MPGRGVVRMPFAVLHCRDTKRHQLGCHLPGGHAERAIISQFCHADVALAAIDRREINLPVHRVTPSIATTDRCSLTDSSLRDVPKPRLLQWAAMVLSAGVPASLPTR
jgi:hypothetical protein